MIFTFQGIYFIVVFFYISFFFKAETITLKSLPNLSFISNTYETFTEIENPNENLIFRKRDKKDSRGSEFFNENTEESLE